MKFLFVLGFVKCHHEGRETAIKWITDMDKQYTLYKLEKLFPCFSDAVARSGGEDYATWKNNYELFEQARGQREKAAAQRHDFCREHS